MTAQPLGYDVIFDENGKPQFSEDAAARLRASLGHDPKPGEVVTLERIDDELSDVPQDVIEDWLRNEVLPTIAEMDAHPERALSVDQVRANLAAARAERLASG